MIDMSVKNIGGVPHLCLDGKSIGINFPYTYSGESSSFSDSGYHIYRISLPTGWCGPDTYDYSDTDAILQSVVDKDPMAKFIPLVWWSSSEEASWWPLYCPEDQCVSCDPITSVKTTKFPQVIDDCERQKLSLRKKYHGQDPSYVSYASKRWQNAVTIAARKFVDHIDQSPYSDRVLGFYVSGGHSYEWMYWGAFIWDGLCDYSQPMQEYFREWLKKKYLDCNLLSNSWKQKITSFANVLIPDASRRYVKFEDVLFDPEIDQDIVDYHYCISDLIADTAVNLCSVMKKSSKNKRLCGLFYGYCFTHGGGKGLSNPQMKSHLSFNKILESEDVDFVASPYDYAYRGVGGVHTSQSLHSSVLQRGKVYISSIDIAVYGDEDGGGPMAGVKPNNWSETNALLVRDFGAALCSGISMSWVDLKGGSFRHPKIKSILGQLKAIEEKYCKKERCSNAEIALVVCNRSQAWMRYDQRLTIPLFSVQKQQYAGEIGAPFDCILQDEILRGGCKKYKLYIFLNSFLHTHESRSALREMLKTQHASAVWIYAPGCLSSDGMDGAYARELCGVSMKEFQLQFPLQVRCPEYDLIYGVGIDQTKRQMQFADESESLSIKRAFLIEPSHGDVVLGLINGTNYPGLVLHQEQKRFDLISSAPAIPSKILRECAIRAGVHIYSHHNDFVCSGGDFLMIYSKEKGFKKIKLPTSATSVTDLLSNENIMIESKIFELNMQSNSTVLLKINK